MEPVVQGHEHGKPSLVLAMLGVLMLVFLPTGLVFLASVMAGH